MWAVRSSWRFCRPPSPVSSDCGRTRDLRSWVTIQISSLQILLSKSDCLQDRNHDLSTRPRADGIECWEDTSVDSILRLPTLYSSAPAPSGNPLRIHRAEFHSKHFAAALRAARAF